MKKTTGFIFDFDGLIVDTEWPEYVAWSEIYQEFNQELTIPTWLQAVGHVQNFDPRADLELKVGKILDWGILDKRRSERHLSLVAEAMLLPGVEEMIREGQKAGLRIGVASNSNREWVTRGLARVGLDSIVEVVRTRDDVMTPKPAPDVYLSCLEALDLKPEETLAFEDSQPGVQAAKRAGLYVIAVPNRLTRFHALEEADHVVESLEGAWQKIHSGEFWNPLTKSNT